MFPPGLIFHALPEGGRGKRRELLTAEQPGVGEGYDKQPIHLVGLPPATPNTPAGVAEGDIRQGTLFPPPPDLTSQQPGVPSLFPLSSLPR